MRKAADYPAEQEYGYPNYDDGKDDAASDREHRRLSERLGDRHAWLWTERLSSFHSDRDHGLFHAVSYFLRLIGEERCQAGIF